MRQNTIHYNSVHSFPHTYLCNYLPLSTGRDKLSYSLLRFKRMQKPDLEAWIDCALEMPGPGFIAPGTTIIRALHHNELHAGDQGPVALDLLGEALARNYAASYLPDLLGKSRPARPIRGLGMDERVSELEGIYVLVGDLPAGPILLIDDILTTAATMKAIIKAVLRANPRPSLQVFTLARADYTPLPGGSDPLRGLNFQFPAGLDWVVAEGPESYSPSPDRETLPPGSATRLKVEIRADSW